MAGTSIGKNWVQKVKTEAGKVLNCGKGGSRRGMAYLDSRVGREEGGIPEDKRVWEAPLGRYSKIES